MSWRCAIITPPAVLPFCIAGKPIKPVFHLGAVIGDETPMWDQHDEFGDTNLLVVKPEEGRSLARALGKHSVVLMLRHGATVVGDALKDLVLRSIFICQNAEYQLRAHMLGAASPLYPGEIRPARRAASTTGRSGHGRGNIIACGSRRAATGRPKATAKAVRAKPKSGPAITFRKAKKKAAITC